MSHIVSLIILLAFLFAGMLLGKIRPLAASKAPRLLLETALYFLLFFMGFRIGRNDEVASRLGDIGILSVVFAAATALGTILVLTIIYLIGGRRLTNRSSSGAEELGPVPGGAARRFFTHLKDPLKLFLIVIAGFLTGSFMPLLPGFTGEGMTTWMVYILLLLVGIQLSGNGVRIGRVLLHPETLILPLGTVVGSLLGGFAVSMIFSLPVGRGLAVASGFGWYSLSGVIITDLGDPVLGSAAFISNMLRESLALLTIPFFGATRFKHVGIGVAGATSMDVSLPLIERSCGARSVPLAVTHGGILSLLVPILVPVFFHA